MTYFPDSDQNWETLSAREAGFDPDNDLILVARWIDQEKISGLIGHIAGALV